MMFVVDEGYKNEKYGRGCVNCLLRLSLSPV